jgi:hypothetical protein
MAKRERTRNVIFRPKEADRRERPWTIAFFAFLILYVCVTFALDDASPVIVPGIWGAVLVVGLAGFIGAGIVRDLKSRQRFRLVFTLYWTEPKKARRAFARQERKKMGLAAYFWPNICPALVLSCLLTLSCLGSWCTSRIDPSRHAIPLPWALVCILLGGITGGALPYLAEFLYILDSPETIGFDSRWMGYLKGRPYKTLWPYERIARIRFESLRTGEREFRLMLVSPREGREVAFALSEEVDVQRIAAFLGEKGVEVAGV